MNLAKFSLDTITFAGSLERKIDANVAAGFTQTTLLAKDLVGHRNGYEAALNEVRLPGLRVNAIQVMRDYEGLSGSDEFSRVIRMIDRAGYRGEWRSEAIKVDYVQTLSEAVAPRARNAGMWVTAQSEQRSLPRTILRQAA